MSFLPVVLEVGAVGYRLHMSPVDRDERFLQHYRRLLPEVRYLPGAGEGVEDEVSGVFLFGIESVCFFVPVFGSVRSGDFLRGDSKCLRLGVLHAGLNPRVLFEGDHRESWLFSRPWRGLPLPNTRRRISRRGTNARRRTFRRLRGRKGRVSRCRMVSCGDYTGFSILSKYSGYFLNATACQRLRTPTNEVLSHLSPSVKYGASPHVAT